jgi:hypothetical protein
MVELHGSSCVLEGVQGSEMQKAPTAMQWMLLFQMDLTAEAARLVRLNGCEKRNSLRCCA